MTLACRLSTFIWPRLRRLGRLSLKNVRWDHDLKNKPGQNSKSSEHKIVHDKPSFTKASSGDEKIEDNTNPFIEDEKIEQCSNPFIDDEKEE